MLAGERVISSDLGFIVVGAKQEVPVISRGNVIRDDVRALRLHVETKESCRSPYFENALSLEIIIPQILLYGRAQIPLPTTEADSWNVNNVVEVARVWIRDDLWGSVQ